MVFYKVIYIFKFYNHINNLIGVLGRYQFAFSVLIDYVAKYTENVAHIGQIDFKWLVNQTSVIIFLLIG